MFLFCTVSQHLQKFHPEISIHGAIRGIKFCPVEISRNTGCMYMVFNSCHFYTLITLKDTHAHPVIIDKKVLFGHIAADVLH